MWISRGYWGWIPHPLWITLEYLHNCVCRSVDHYPAVEGGGSSIVRVVPMSDEQPLATWKAARSMDRVAVPGELQVTKTHVVFEPKGRRAQGARFAVKRSFIAGVGRAPGTGKFFSGGKQERLCLTLGDGSEWLFVVPALDEAITGIGEWMAKRSRG